MLNPVFLGGNRMVTRVVANKQRQQKSKTNLLMEKSSKEYSVASLVEEEKFNLGKKKLGNKVQAKSLNLPCRFC